MAERKRARFKVLDDGRRDGPPPEAEGELAPSSAVAATLRKARMASGRSVQEVADLLRIRRAYLTAIEEGRFADLPGPAYAVGFVRSFADHLGLDSDGLVDRFKEEIASVGSLDKRTDLTFPEPVSEGRVPNVPLLLIAVGLAAAIYGGWYYYSTRDRIAVDRVPEPPVLAGQRAEPSAAEPAPVVPPTEEAADSEAPVDRAPQEAAAPSEASPVPAPPERPAGESERPSEGAVGAEAPATSVTVAPATAPSPVRDVAAPPATAAPATAAPPTRDVAAPPAPAAPATAPPPTRDVAAAPATAAPPAEAAPAPRAQSAPPAREEARAPVVHGPAGTRVVLRALADSWIQIRQADGTLLATLVLREGDVYRVPDRPGLTLMAGNAGALAVSVDGAPAPPIGAAGKVRRDVLLDPDALRAGPPPSE